MFKLINRIKERLFGSDVNTEHELDEVVEHDIVMEMIDGKLTDITEVIKDDTEIRQ